MIKQGIKDILDIYHGTLRVIEVYHGKLLVYKISNETSNSCFGNGYWVNELPWDNDDGWVN